VRRHDFTVGSKLRRWQWKSSRGTAEVPDTRPSCLPSPVESSGDRRETNELEPSGTTVNRAEGGGPTCRHAIADCAEELDRLFTIERQKLFWMLRVEMQPIRPIGRP
jgi:hypothetical protein